MYYRKLKHGFGEEHNQPAEPPQRKQPIQLPKENPPSPSSSSVAPPVSPPAVTQPTRVVPSRPPPTVTADEELYEDTRAPTRVSTREEEPYDDNLRTQQSAAVTSPSSGPHVRNLLAEGIPKRLPDSDDEKDEQNWDG